MRTLIHYILNLIIISYKPYLVYDNNFFFEMNDNENINTSYFVFN